MLYQPEMFEPCPYCGKEGLKRSHSSLYEMNGWLHICKSEPLKHQQLTWNKGDGQILKDDPYEDDYIQCNWEYLGEQVGTGY